MVENAALGFQEHVLWRIGDALKAIFEMVRWPFERAAWAIEDRFRALSAPGRISAAAASAALGVAIAIAAFALVDGGGSGATTATPIAATAQPIERSAAAPKPKPAAPEPTLHGATPVFKSPAKADSAKVDPAKSVAEPAPSDSTQPKSFSAATDRISSQPTASSSAAAETSVIPGRPAGAKAIAVANDFAGAFVLYETGGEESEVRSVFAKTTTPELSKALLKRPPRLPAGVEVPKAKVLNIVPGPSRQGVYTLSVALLRVGITSELRLEMEKLKDQGWRVTNVLG